MKFEIKSINEKRKFFRIIKVESDSDSRLTWLNKCFSRINRHQCPAVVDKGNLDKSIQLERAILKVKYPFLTPTQIQAKAYEKFGIPTVAGKIKRWRLKAETKEKVLGLLSSSKIKLETPSVKRDPEGETESDSYAYQEESSSLSSKVSTMSPTPRRSARLKEKTGGARQDETLERPPKSQDSACTSGKGRGRSSIRETAKSATQKTKSPVKARPKKRKAPIRYDEKTLEFVELKSPALSESKRKKDSPVEEESDVLEPANRRLKSKAVKTPVKSTVLDKGGSSSSSKKSVSFTNSPTSSERRKSVKKKSIGYGAIKIKHPSNESPGPPIVKCYAGSTPKEVPMRKSPEVANASLQTTPKKSFLGYALRPRNLQSILEEAQTHKGPCEDKAVQTKSPIVLEANDTVVETASNDEQPMGEFSEDSSEAWDNVHSNVDGIIMSLGTSENVERDMDYQVTYSQTVVHELTRLNPHNWLARIISPVLQIGDSGSGKSPPSSPDSFTDIRSIEENESTNFDINTIELESEEKIVQEILQEDEEDRLHRRDYYSDSDSSLKSGSDDFPIGKELLQQVEENFDYGITDIIIPPAPNTSDVYYEDFEDEEMPATESTSDTNAIAEVHYKFSSPLRSFGYQFDSRERNNNSPSYSDNTSNDAASIVDEVAPMPDDGEQTPADTQNFHSQDNLEMENEGRNVSSVVPEVCFFTPAMDKVELPMDKRAASSGTADETSEFTAMLKTASSLLTALKKARETQRSILGEGKRNS